MRVGFLMTEPEGCWLFCLLASMLEQSQESDSLSLDLITSRGPFTPTLFCDPIKLEGSTHFPSCDCSLPLIPLGFSGTGTLKRFSLHHLQRTNSSQKRGKKSSAAGRLNLLSEGLGTVETSIKERAGLWVVLEKRRRRGLWDRCKASSVVLLFSSPRVLVLSVAVHFSYCAGAGMDRGCPFPGPVSSLIALFSFNLMWTYSSMTLLSLQQKMWTSLDWLDLAWRSKQLCRVLFCGFGGEVGLRSLWLLISILGTLQIALSSGCSLSSPSLQHWCSCDPMSWLTSSFLASFQPVQ